MRKLTTRSTTAQPRQTAAAAPLRKFSAALRRNCRRYLAGSSVLLMFLGYQPPALAVEQACYAIADNGGTNGDPSGGATQDTLVQLDLVTGNVVTIGPITRPDGSAVLDIEAATSRVVTNQLFAANDIGPDVELGIVGPTTGNFVSIGTVGQFDDFDAIDFDQDATGQIGNRIIGVSVDNPNSSQNNRLVTINLATNAANQVTGISSVSDVALGAFPAGTEEIDGLAVVPPNSTLPGANPA
ncbi:MAG: hypothetical protein F6J97_07345, partial [Leptolyngbya sp. SIO4C1]|nr:hypothetical protein [Leptolyngbya sp. SIO4C1]